MGSAIPGAVSAVQSATPQEVENIVGKLDPELRGKIAVALDGSLIAKENGKHDDTSQLLKEGVKKAKERRSSASSNLGEDEDNYIAPLVKQLEAGAHWHITSQQPWQLGREHCTLTMLENAAEGLVQFELIKNSNQTTMHVTCTNQQFDDLLKEQSGLGGAAQTNAAISQLFREAHEEIEKPKEGADPHDDFGEDFGGEFSDLAAPRAEVEPEAHWHIKSQQPWQLGREHCTLTILENAGEGLVQFELIKNSNHTTMHVTCTNQQFDELLKEQSGLSGAAQTNAAIAQLFREAHEEIEKPKEGADPHDDFGEDPGGEFAHLGTPRAKVEPEAHWHIKSQQPWQLGSEHCTLTILENAGEGLVQFELIKNSNHTTMHVTCANEQFDELLKEKSGLSGAAQMNAAIAQLFKEAHEEIEKPKGGADPDDDFGEDFGGEFAGLAAPRDSSKGEPQAQWHIKSQQPWQLGPEHCTLTILENLAEGMVQFELVKNSTQTTMHVTCTNGQFEELLKEQSGLSGAARTNAAISQMFREAHEEIEKP